MANKEAYKELWVDGTRIQVVSWQGSLFFSYLMKRTGDRVKWSEIYSMDPNKWSELHPLSLTEDAPDNVIIPWVIRGLKGVLRGQINVLLRERER